MTFYPETDQLFSVARDHADKPLLEVNRSLYSILGGVIWFVISAVVVYYLNLTLPGSPLSDTHPVFKYINVRWLIVIPIGILVEMVRRYHNDLYVFETDQLTHYHGRLALAYRVPVIKYAHIRAITVVQGILGRIFNFGNIEVGTAAEVGLEMRIVGVRAPRELADLIGDLRNHQTAQQTKSASANNSNTVAKAV